MKILALHNFYQQPGGEDAIFHDETRLMETHGHEVVRHTVHNDAIEGMSRLTVARKTIYNRASFQTIRELIRQHRPDIVHSHNTFPLISPAVYDACRAERVAVVQNVQNYRLSCPTATFYRDDRVCEDCLGKTFPYPGVIHKCYRGSRLGSLVVASMIARHRLGGTWRKKVTRFIVPNQFMKRKLAQAGLPDEKIVVKPNFVWPDPGFRPGDGRYAVFAGRLTKEKGILTLLEAWRRLGGTRQLKILGGGPLEEVVRAQASTIAGVEFLGRRAPADLAEIVGRAGVLICPSEWYEGQPKVIVESFAVGTPVITSRLGGMEELAVEGETGWLIEPGNVESIATRVAEVMTDPTALLRMRARTREYFQRHFSAETNYTRLRSIYEEAIAVNTDKT